MTPTGELKPIQLLATLNELNRYSSRHSNAVCLDELTAYRLKTTHEAAIIARSLARARDDVGLVVGYQKVLRDFGEIGPCQRAKLKIGRQVIYDDMARIDFFTASKLRP